MRDSLTNMFKAKNLDTKDPSIKKTINQRIENLLSVADENGDGKLTKEEILKACKKDPSLLVMF
jgi:Ca2+-binding EF-hand superfamily protein